MPPLGCLEASSQAWVAFTSLHHNLGAASRMHSPKCCFRAPFSQIYRPSEPSDLRNPLVQSYFAKEMQGTLRPTEVTLLQRANWYNPFGKHWALLSRKLEVTYTKMLQLHSQECTLENLTHTCTQRHTWDRPSSGWSLDVRQPLNRWMGCDIFTQWKTWQQGKMNDLQLHTKHEWISKTAC